MKKVRQIESLFELLRIVVAFLLAYGLVLIVLCFISEDPAKAIYSFVVGPFTTPRRFGQTIQKTIPLIFTGLGMCFMYNVDRFNLSGEGIFILSACSTTYLALSLENSGLPKPLFIIILLLAGALIGFIVASIPAIINAKLGCNIIVLSLMLNYIMLFFTQFVLTRVIRDTAVAYTASYEIPKNARFGELIPKTGIHTGLLAALVVFILVSLFFHKTKFGFEMRTVGNNINFARNMGIPAILVIILAQAFGGALAGMGGALEQLAMNSRFQWTELTNHGMNGVVVAVLAKKKPQYVILTAFLMAYIRQGAQVVSSSTDIPLEFVVVVQGIIILMVASEAFLANIRNKLIYKEALQAKDEKGA